MPFGRCSQAECCSLDRGPSRAHHNPPAEANRPSSGLGYRAVPGLNALAINRSGEGNMNKTYRYPGGIGGATPDTCNQVRLSGNIRLIEPTRFDTYAPPRDLDRGKLSERLDELDQVPERRRRRPPPGGAKGTPTANTAYRRTPMSRL